MLIIFGLVNIIRDEFTSIYLATYGGHKDAVKLLLKLNANPEITAPDKSTCLMLATQRDDNDMVAILARSGKANINDHSHDSVAPLHIAVEKVRYMRDATECYSPKMPLYCVILYFSASFRPHDNLRTT